MQIIITNYRLRYQICFSSKSYFMTEWLLDIGNKYLNKGRVSFVCRGMLYILFAPILILLLGLLFGTNFGEELSIIGQISNLLFDLCLAIVCLSVMVLVYEDGYKMPTIGLFVVITVIKGVYQFFITSIGGKGELYTLIFVLCLILHTTVGFQLLKTGYSIFGKALLYYIGGVVIAAALKASRADTLSTIVIFLTGCMLANTFFKYLPHYYKH